MIRDLLKKIDENWSFYKAFLFVSFIGLVVIGIAYLFVIWKILPLQYEKYLVSAARITFWLICYSLVLLYFKSQKEKRKR